MKRNPTKPPLLEHWPRKAEYLVCVDESGDHGLNYVDDYWPILSICGVVIELSEFDKLKVETNALKSTLWPPDGTFLQKNGKRRKVCFHSRDMRHKLGPFGESVLSPDARAHLDTVLWEQILRDTDWQAISCVIDKQRLLQQYTYPGDPYLLAVTFLLERVVMNVKKPVGVLFERRGRDEDRRLWEHIKELFSSGTGFIRAYELAYRIVSVGWHPKFNSAGHVVCGLELADLCSYVYGASYLGRSPRYMDVIRSKLIGYSSDRPGAEWGYGFKVFPPVPVTRT